MAKLSTDVDETIKEAFYIFDSDGSGAISSEEFRKVMMTLGAQMTDEEVSEIIEEVDVDGDGQINLEGTFGRNFNFICRLQSERLNFLVIGRKFRENINF